MFFENNEALLLSDLVYFYLKTESNIFYDEIEKRMNFCGYTKDEIDMFIDFEGDIIEANNDIYNKTIINKYFIIGNQNKKNLLPENELAYQPDKKGKTILLSETLAALDEAIFITYSNSLNKYKAHDEIVSLAHENAKSWLHYEFMNRMEYVCRCANHIIDGGKKAMFSKKNGILYDNEMQIITTRWKDINVQARKFIPYSNEYYER